MDQQVRKLILICLLSFLVDKVRSGQQRTEPFQHQFFINNYLDYEKGLIYKSLKQLQDSVSLVNNNLFTSPLNKNLYKSLYKSLYNHGLRKLNDQANTIDRLDSNRKLDFGVKFDPKASLKIIQQLNKEIIKNQMIAYEQFFDKLKRYDSDQMESRQVVNAIKTLFRFPILLLFSNIFQLPLLPTLILASPFLNQDSSNPLANSLMNSISKTPLSTAVTNAVSNAVSNGLSNGVANSIVSSSSGSVISNQLQTASSNQMNSNFPFSLNPLVPINQLLNNFINELIGDLQNTPLINNLMQSVNQVLVKPNRLSGQNQLQNSQNNLQNQQLTTSQQNSNQLTLNQINSNQSASNQSINLNSNQSKPIAISSNSSANIDPLSTSESAVSFVVQEPPNSFSYEPLPNRPLIGPVQDENGNIPSASVLNTLASSLLESSKNYQITETLGINPKPINELAINAKDTLSTLFKIKRKKKDMNDDMILNLLTDKNYIKQLTSISNLMKMGLKHRMEKEMNLCMVRAICESNQKQIGFAFDQIFSLTMHLTGMEKHIERSPWHSYFDVGRKMINEKNACKLLPKCTDDDMKSSKMEFVGEIAKRMIKSKKSTESTGEMMEKMKKQDMMNKMQKLDLRELFGKMKRDKMMNLMSMLNKIQRVKKIGNLLDEREESRKSRRKNRFMKKLFRGFLG